MKLLATPHRLSLLAGVSAVLAVVMVEWLPLPWWGRALLAGAAVYGIGRLLIRFVVYRRLRDLEQEVRAALNSRENSTAHWGNDSVQNLQIGIRDLIRSSQRELGELKQLEVYRREFLGDVSHELKTPLFAIEGFLETLLDGALEDKNVNRKFLRQALRNTERLTDLVRDLLVISQLESGEMAMNLEEFRIYDLVLDVFDLLDYKRTHNERNVNLAIKAPGLEALTVRADKDRIRQVLVNLVDNAIIYGRPSGTVTVELRTNGTPQLLHVLVHDDGNGISEAHLPHLFSRFYRVDKSRSREGGGTGLGLSIVKNLIEAHGQTITVRSVAGAGTTFDFTLPIARKG